ncbi:winged helix-turn-helix domain-containing protein [Methanohalobium sp.]|uniref:helix-turn-helix transcriptional regulator n=1 Tax=Methanohalobium sp. TaxID=2837493 RepID=UPI0025E5FD1E|nr:winged helix-turn-helix domain-containing protein [Methanohalobium sp.]
MKAALLGTLFLSDKRKNILMYLLDGHKNIDDIKDELATNTSAIMTQMKILMDQGLVTHNADFYELTTMGNVIVKKMKPLLDTLNVYGENKHYWETRDLRAIPSNLLDRFEEIGHSKLIEPDLSHLFEPPNELVESLKSTQHVMTFYSFFCPELPTTFTGLVKRGVSFELILTKSVFERLKDEFSEEYHIISGSDNGCLYICDDNIIKPATLVITDDLMLLSLFNEEGVFDHKKLISFDSCALQWAKELFEYYKNKAEK